MSYDVIEVSSADELNALGWDGLLTTVDYYLSAEWCDAVAKAEDAEPLYLVAVRGGRAIGGLATHRVDANSSAFYRIDRQLGRYLNTVGGGSAPAVLETLVPTLTCAGRHLGTSRMPLAPDLVEPERIGIAEALLNRAEALARRRGAATMSFLAVDEGDGLLSGLLRARGYQSFANGVQSVLELPAGGFRAYRLSLSRRGRQTVASDQRRIASAGYTFPVHRLDDELLDRLAPLEAEVNGKYGGVTDLDRIKHNHAKYAKVLPRGMNVLLATNPAGQVHGFVTFIEWRGRVLARNWGKHPDVPSKLPLYFNTVYYALIDWCYAHHITSIDFVTGAERVKKLRGCTQTAKVAFLRGMTARARRTIADGMATAGLGGRQEDGST